MAFAVPGKILDNAEILRRFPKGNMESFLKVIGIEQRHILSVGESESDVAVKAAEELFAQTGVDRSEIDAISITVDFRLWTTKPFCNMLS